VRKLDVPVIVLAAVCLLGAARSGTRTYTMQSTSMKPTIKVGDSVLVDLHAKCCRRGTIVVFNPRKVLGRAAVAADIKRVIASRRDDLRMCTGWRVHQRSPSSRALRQDPPEADLLSRRAVRVRGYQST
jgi:hypothetical protein